ncbi:MAG: TIGR03618 family F420-dependent PPOX class oxidoreductase [Ilumatobacteraceae bacterium]
MTVILSPALLEFVRERHLASLTTLRPDGSPHVVPVGFTVRDDAGTPVVRVITFADAVKVRNARAGGRAAVTQIDGARWVTFEGVIKVADDAASVAAAVEAYAGRYRPPKVRDDRVVLEITVDRVMCSSSLR